MAGAASGGGVESLGCISVSDHEESCVPPSNPSSASESVIELKDPLVAGFLAWLMPGLGHFYQGRYAKGALFAICILGTFVYGLYLGGSSQPYLGPDTEIGWGRAVYFAFDDKEWHLPWLCQIGVGLPTLPMTMLQYSIRSKPVLHGFMAPPAPERDEPANPCLATIQHTLPHFFELGTVYTMIAGLLNILAIYDASCGPVAATPKDDDGDAGSQSDDEEGKS
jgi:hypothetical protein